MEPKLVEPGVKYFIGATLKQCQKTREKYESTVYNIVLFVISSFIIGCILTYKYKGKITPVEKEINSRKKQEYILDKIKIMQQAQTKQQQQLITNLPLWD